MPRKTVSKMKARTKLKAQLKSSLSRKVVRPKGLSRNSKGGDSAAAKITIRPWTDKEIRILDGAENSPRPLTKKQINALGVVYGTPVVRLAGQEWHSAEDACTLAYRFRPTNTPTQDSPDPLLGFIADDGIQPFTWKDLIPVGCILLAGIILGVCAYLFGLGGER